MGYLLRDAYGAQTGGQAVRDATRDGQVHRRCALRGASFTHVPPFAVGGIDGGPGGQT